MATEPEAPVVPTRSLDEWRQERRRLEAQRLDRWMGITQNTLCLIVPVLGLAWVVFYFALAETVEQKAPELRLRGAICAAWMLLGVVVEVVCWKLWGLSILRGFFPAWSM